MNRELQVFKNNILSLKKEALQIDNKDVENYYVENGVIKGITHVRVKTDEITCQVINRTESTDIISKDKIKVSKLKTILEFEKTYKYILGCQK